MSRVVLSAAEPSGDALGAALARALRALEPGIELLGVAGPHMRAAGVRAVARADDLGVMGVVEVLGAAPRLLAARRALAGALREGAEVFVPIDAPDFHLPVARRVGRAGLPVVLFGAPQVWAWRRGRARDIATWAAEVLCLLPFEVEVFAQVGGRARYVGHPAAERVVPSPPGGDWALLPGSRRAEIERILPAMLQAAARLRAARPGARIRLGRAESVDPAWLAAAGPLDGVEVVEGLAAAAEPARACLVASGTATLELALMGRPMVVAYAVHPLTYAVGRALVTGVEHIALPNLILGRTGVPEHIQTLDPARLCADWMAAADTQAEALAEVRRRVGPPGAARRAAAAVLEAIR
ncbi:MAG: lipid-A-disaccharide synthase [Alphaproteobacteria bacterium]|nr:lipid-A-disaccharide synthase [Alphaproteobacteria bacterium]